MTDDDALEQRRAELRAELDELSARAEALEAAHADAEVTALEREVTVLLARIESVEATLLDGREKLDRLRDDLRRVLALGAIDD